MPLSLCVSNISKQFNGKYTLKDCSYAFDGGGVFALLGPNGCGKSTLLRICNFSETPDKGDVIYVSDQRVERNDIALKRRIAMVQPGEDVFNATVFMNAAHALKTRKVGRIAIDDRVEKALEAVGLIHKKQMNANALSGGEIQRLALARAIITGPEVLFLDEPTFALDEENALLVEDIILAIKKDGKTTVIIATPDRDQAARLADHVVAIHDGRIIE